MIEIMKDLSKILLFQDTVVVATSGGPDSMALLSMICKLKNSLNLTIICAHVNHKLRIESDSEKILVEDYCTKNDIIFEYMEINRYNHDNFHNDARSKRYYFFEELIKKYNAKYLFTAHHADDLAETIIMRIIRGSTLSGYAGIPKISNRDNYQIVRPLLYIGKDDLLKYCIKYNIPYAIDKSNMKDTYLRNRIRKYIIPQLKEESPNFYKKINQFSNELLENDIYIKKVINEKVLDIFVNNIIDLKKLKEEDKFLQKRIIMVCLEKIYIDDLKQIGVNHVNLLLNMIENDKPNIVINFPNNIILHKSYDKIYIEYKQEIGKDYKIEITTETVLPNGKTISIEKQVDKNDNYICRLSSKDVSLPLYVRNRRNGDFMIIKGMTGRKKIKSIFIENKIDIRERQNYPIVVDSNDEVVWLPGLKKSHLDKQINENCDIILRYY